MTDSDLLTGKWKKQTCADCDNFYPTEPNDLGECRYLPPTRILQPFKHEHGSGWQMVSAFPTTRKELWCAQWRPVKRNDAITG